MSSPRDEVLTRIREALGTDPRPIDGSDSSDGSSGSDAPRRYRDHGEAAAGSPEAVAQLVDRLEDYRATVVRSNGDDAAVGVAIATALATRGIDEVIAPSGVPAPWLHGIGTVVVDDGSAGARDLDGIPAVVTGSVVAVSETGTIGLDNGPACGRRITTLLPDTHVCVVRAVDVVQTVPEGLARLDPTRPITLVSGPSATSDIELSRVEGVHGPRNLIVVIAG